MPTLLRASLALVLVLAAGCATPRGSADRADLSASPLLRACPAGSTERMNCLEQALLDTLRVEGIAAAMATLERIGAADAEIRRDGHVYAHVIGLAAYTTPESVGRAFAECTPAFQSGCYHGVIQSYFVDVGRSGRELGAAEVNALCADYRRDDALWLLFQCAHGMGHGVTMVNDFHLPRALGACDLLESPWERDACYGGAFMEMIVNEVAPHHGPGRPQHGDHGDHGQHGEHAHHEHHHHPAPDPPAPEHAHAHHDHGAHGAADDRFPALNPDDHHYPCSVLAEHYLGACYMMQTSVVLHLTGGSFAAAAEMCDGAPAAHRRSCYTSLGRDVSSAVVGDHRRALRRCEVGDPAMRQWCHVGYVKNVVDVTADEAQGFAYCRLLPAGAGKELCYRSVGEQIAILGPTPKRRETMCEAAEPNFRAACRAGAGLAAPTEAADAR